MPRKFAVDSLLGPFCSQLLDQIETLLIRSRVRGCSRLIEFLLKLPIHKTVQ
jgi:hypothetical protein